MFSPSVYTPAQVAEILQVSKNTVYELINNGEIVAKRLGKLYRIPAQSIAFAFTGLDSDLYKAELEDLESVKKVRETIKEVRDG